MGHPDNATGEGQTIELDIPSDATQVSVIGTGTEKNQQATGTLNFSDGSTAPINLSFGDWTGSATNPQYGNIPVAVTTTASRVGRPSTQKAAIFASAPLALPAGKQAVSLTLPDQPGTLRNDGRIHVFAIASDGTPVDREPLAVTAGDGVSVVVGAPIDEAVLATVTGGRATEESPLRAAITWGDGSDVAAGTVTAGEPAQVTGAHAYAEAGTYTVHVVVDDGWASKAVEVPVTVTEAAPALDITTTGRTQCMGSKVYVAVQALNGEDVPVSIMLVTPFGEKTFASVAPGKSAYQAFSSRAGAVAAGTATVRASATIDGQEISSVFDVPYAAISCS